MTRALLLAAVVCLVLLIGSRGRPETLSPVADSSLAAVPTVRPARPPTVPKVIPPVIVPGRPLLGSAAEDRTPVISRMARIEARRRLELAEGVTYLDSLFTTPDSVVRRWTDRSLLRVAVLPSPDGLAPIESVREALAEWTDGRIGLSFLEVADTLIAEIVVGWIDQFETLRTTSSADSGRTGLTEVRSDEMGQIQRARVSLARLDGAGQALDPTQIRAIAIHEIGHSIGLPHSGHREDIMYPTVVATRLSERDRATAALMYLLPSGPLRER